LIEIISTANLKQEEMSRTSVWIPKHQINQEKSSSPRPIVLCEMGQQIGSAGSVANSTAGFWRHGHIILSLRINTQHIRGRIAEYKKQRGIKSVTFAGTPMEAMKPLLEDIKKETGIEIEFGPSHGGYVLTTKQPIIYTKNGTVLTLEPSSESRKYKDALEMAKNVLCEKSDVIYTQVQRCE
jgi:hypothetical protein